MGVSIEKQIAEVELCKDSGFRLEMRVGDIFCASNTTSLAHCISSDCKLNSGISKIFKEKFAQLSELKKYQTTVGNVVVVRNESRFIYNLVTKKRFYGKPKYDAIRRCLEQMKDHAKRYGVTEISMPKIGCGFESLQWSVVKALIESVFERENIRIYIYIRSSKYYFY
jgi:O-acetyl-ADP-ribose deacetylase (regulator of RNase III)